MQEASKSNYEVDFYTTDYDETTILQFLGSNIPVINNKMPLQENSDRIKNYKNKGRDADVRISLNRSLSLSLSVSVSHMSLCRWFVSFTKNAFEVRPDQKLLN